MRPSKLKALRGLLVVLVVLQLAQVLVFMVAGGCGGIVYFGCMWCVVVEMGLVFAVR